MGRKLVQVDENKKPLTVDGAVYDFTPGRRAFIMQKHPRIGQWTSRDYQAYKSLCIHTKERLFPNPEGAARPHATWEYKHMLRKMVKVVHGEIKPSLCKFFIFYFFAFSRTNISPLSRGAIRF